MPTKPKRYKGGSYSLEPDKLAVMVGGATEIALSTFYKHMALGERENLNRLGGYTDRHRISDDIYNRKFFRSTYDGHPCVYVQFLKWHPTAPNHIYVWFNEPEDD